MYCNNHLYSFSHGDNHWLLLFLPHSFWRRNKKLGKITLALENFDLTFETSMWCRIQTEKNKITNGALFEIISDDSLITDERKRPSFRACNSSE